MKNKLPKDCFLHSFKFKLSQEADNYSLDRDDQEIEIEFQDAGGGLYPVIKTKRWAYDEDESDQFFGFIKELCNIVNDAVNKEE